VLKSYFLSKAKQTPIKWEFVKNVAHIILSYGFNKLRQCGLFKTVSRFCLSQSWNFSIHQRLRDCCLPNSSVDFSCGNCGMTEKISDVNQRNADLDHMNRFAVTKAMGQIVFRREQTGICRFCKSHIFIYNASVTGSCHFSVCLA
jgi:hypothetical protein